MLDVKLNIGRDDLRPRFYAAKFPIYDKGLKKKLKSWSGGACI